MRLSKLFKNDIIGNLEIYHVGKCGFCGNKLITQDDIEKGMHDTCSKNLNIHKEK